MADIPPEEELTPAQKRLLNEHPEVKAHHEWRRKARLNPESEERTVIIQVINERDPNG